MLSLIMGGTSNRETKKLACSGLYVMGKAYPGVYTLCCLAELQ